MRTLAKYGLAALLLIALPVGTSWAGLTVAAKTGPMMVDVSGADDPTNGGIMLGWELEAFVLDLALEAEITQTMEDGSNGESMDTAGAYFSLRTGGPLYFIGKVGYVNWEFENDFGKADDTDESMGLGIGFSVLLLKVEVEYTQINDDVNFVSVGVRW